jgi:prevent-host-death family protein
MVVDGAFYRQVARSGHGAHGHGRDTIGREEGPPMAGKTRRKRPASRANRSASPAPVMIAAGVFKARCFELMDEVARTRRRLVVTKRGRAVVEVIPASPLPTPDPFFGALRGVITIEGDLGAPEPWDPDEVVREWETLARPGDA